VLTVAYLNTVWNVDEFSAVDYTLNILSKSCFSLYLNIRGLRKGLRKFFMVVAESPGFFVSKRVGAVCIN